LADHRFAMLCTLFLLLLLPSRTACQQRLDHQAVRQR
jgi:hypothetical protein